jgi:methylated-DNA-protein-cysteine methyltransferase related protein
MSSGGRQRSEARDHPFVTPLQKRFRAVIDDLAPGEVVSYGEVARRAGKRGAARAVGGFLAEHGAGLPWWRVVRADGTLAVHKPCDQARRLRAEGVEVRGGRVIDALP